jgi:hypothetical protein
MAYMVANGCPLDAFALVLGPDDHHLLEQFQRLQVLWKQMGHTDPLHHLLAEAAANGAQPATEH